MKAGWTEVALGEIFDLDLDSVTVDPSVSYEMVGVLSYGRGLFGKPSVTGVESSYKTFFRLNVGQIVLSQLFGWEGAIAPVTPEYEGHFVSSQFPTFRPKSNLDSKFARWVIRNPRVWEQLKSAAKGMGDRRRTLNPEIFFNATTPLPPITEQQTIVAHLDAIEQRLTNVKKLRAGQELELNAALHSAFHKLCDNAVWRPLGEVAPLAWRRIVIDPDENYSEFGVRSFYKGIFHRRKVPGSVFSWQELYRLKAGDIVFSNIMAWEKAIAVARAEHDGWVGNHRMLICEPRPELVCSNYLLHYFMTEDGFAKILRASPGTAARNKTLRADSLMAIEVPVASLTHQRAFDDLCENVDRVRATQESREAEIACLLPSLLDRAFNG